MKTIKRAACLWMSLICMLGIAACKDNGTSEIPQGQLTCSSTNTQKGYDPISVLDGDVNVGWIGGKKATESNFQVFDIDFGTEKTFSKITLDDSFTDGYTNKKPDYISKIATYQNGNASSVGDGTLAGVLSGGADGQSWKSESVPTEAAPHWIWLSLSEAISVKKLELNNEMNNSVAVSYELYYSSEAHNRRNEEEYTDVTTYTLLDKKTDNEENIIEIELEEEIFVRDLFFKIYSQKNEGADVVASMDEILFFGETPDDYYEEHQPEKFTLMGSNDGKEFSVIVEVAGNYDVVWKKTLETAVTYRYIRYVVFKEYNNNYPSIGEIYFE